MPDFTYSPSGLTIRRKPRVNVAKFGDGYEQRSGDGINNNLRMFDLQFNDRTTADALAIDTFLTTKNAVTSFTFDDPDGNTVTVVCRSWSRSYINGSFQNVRAVFEEVQA